MALEAAAGKEPMKERTPRVDQAELRRRTFDLEQLNAKKIRTPWIEDRLVLYSLAPPRPQSAEPPCAPSTAPSGIWC